MKNENDRLVYGLVHSSPAPEPGAAAPAEHGRVEPAAAARPLENRLRDLTLCWSRYAYHGTVIEAPGVDEVLDRAADEGYRYCFVQSAGHIIEESWAPLDGDHRDFVARLDAWASSHEFLVAGRVHGDRRHWFGVEPGGLLVDLWQYHRLGRPPFTAPGGRASRLPKLREIREGGRIVQLAPEDGAAEVSERPGRPGWPLVAASLRDGLPVRQLDNAILSRTLNLAPAEEAQRRQLAIALEPDGSPGPARDALSDEQRRFVDMVRQQTDRSRRAVGLWNIEPYDDVRLPLPDATGPLDALYSVAQGFKPNMILHRHGMHAATRVCLFDYSPVALRVKQTMIEEWDGEDFPGFVKTLFRKFPSPETHYYLWDGRTPETVGDDELHRMWQRELEQWGGAGAFRDHWREYRRLEHRFLSCNLLSDPRPVLQCIRGADRAATWWSNAFFTMYSNWYYSGAERRKRYERWIEQLAERHPGLYLFGSDYNNSSVNAVQAGRYLESYRHRRSGDLAPCAIHAVQIPM